MLARALWGASPGQLRGALHDDHGRGRLPEHTFTAMGADGPQPITTADIFAGKKVALFAVPGAYAPTCHRRKHMPGFVARLGELAAKGVDTVACGGQRHLRAKELGKGHRGSRQCADAGRRQRRVRTEDRPRHRPDGARARRALKRYAMLVEDGIVKVLNVEDAPPGDKSRRRDPVLDDRLFDLSVTFSVSPPPGAGRRRTKLPERLHALARELVRPLVLGVSGVALDPVEAHLVARAQGIEPLPQLRVLDRFPCRPSSIRSFSSRGSRP